eukprot:TRINITY_DN20206_c0_g1_i2.p1 TRINITY_DN20206_c0_g1~~TRINITY_DN20206_c0_g1_i2.p1  ORF type:complete len:215 (+),score=15.97 TRINITY_DN20206_c0_g1_i2:41-646(+)
MDDAVNPPAHRPLYARDRRVTSRPIGVVDAAAPGCCGFVPPKVALALGSFTYMIASIAFALPTATKEAWTFGERPRFTLIALCAILHLVLSMRLVLTAEDCTLTSICRTARFTRVVAVLTVLLLVGLGIVQLVLGLAIQFSMVVVLFAGADVLAYLTLQRLQRDMVLRCTTTPNGQPSSKEDIGLVVMNNVAREGVPCEMY